MLWLCLWGALALAAEPLSCAMHPEVHAEHAGTCPICGMELVPGVASSGEDPGPPLPVICEEAAGCAPSVAALRAVVDTAVGSRDRLLHLTGVQAFTDPEVLEVLLHDEDGWVRAWAATTLRDGEGALEGLKAASQDGRLDPQGFARLAAVDARMARGDASAELELKAWLQVSDPTSRAAAAGYAGRYPALRQAVRELDNPPPMVKDFALLGLASGGDPDALASLTDRWDARTYRIHAEHNPAVALPRLRTLVAAPLPDDALAMQSRIEAGRVLVELDDPAGRESLLSLAESLPEDVAAGEVFLVLEALRGQLRPGDVGRLGRWLSSDDPLIRAEAAVSALSAIDLPPLVPPTTGAVAGVQLADLPSGCLVALDYAKAFGDKDGLSYITSTWVGPVGAGGVGQGVVLDGAIANLGVLDAEHWWAQAQWQIEATSTVLAWTHDGGASWERNTSPWPVPVYSFGPEVGFLDPVHGWAQVEGVDDPSYEGTVRFRSQDGGRRWEIVDRGPEHWPSSEAPKSCKVVRRPEAWVVRRGRAKLASFPVR